MREYMDVEQERQKVYYDRSRYGPSYKFGEEVLIFNPTVKKEKQEKLLHSMEYRTLKLSF